MELVLKWKHWLRLLLQMGLVLWLGLRLRLGLGHVG